MINHPPILLLPGLAANLRLFVPQLKAFDSALVPAWPPLDTPDERERDASLDHYAERFLRLLQQHNHITPPPIVVGFSFGGQVALSLAKAAIRLDAPLPAAIVLVSAPRSAEQLTPAFKRRAALVTRIAPTCLFAIAARLIMPRLFARAINLDARHVGDLKAMAAEIDYHELKHQTRLARAWDCSKDDYAQLKAHGVPVHHIHATDDPVIPAPPPDTPHYTPINDRAHLLTLTHADTVNNVIAAAARNTTPPLAFPD